MMQAQVKQQEQERRGNSSQQRRGGASTRLGNTIPAALGLGGAQHNKACWVPSPHHTKFIRLGRKHCSLLLGQGGQHGNCASAGNCAHLFFPSSIHSFNLGQGNCAHLTVKAEHTKRHVPGNASATPCGVIPRHSTCVKHVTVAHRV